LPGSYRTALISRPPSLNSKRASAVKTILVLHGYVPIRTAIVQLLRDCGYRVLEMASTDEAIVAMKGTAIPVDAILGEIDIPGIINGFEFAQWARSVRPDAKILLAGTPEPHCGPSAVGCSKRLVRFK
jgi:CheY-like chemotaxis protein